MDTLVAKIKSFYIANSQREFPAKLPPPATWQQIEKAEKELGFRLPPLLKELYLEVSNGGFGPGIVAEDETGWRGWGYSLEKIVSNYLDISNLYTNRLDKTNYWKESLRELLPINGLDLWESYLLDCRTEDGPIFSYDHQGILNETPEAPNLRSWLKVWLKRELLEWNGVEDSSLNT